MTINRFLGKAFGKKVLFEDVGYDTYRDCNLYACICPSCRLRLIEFDDYDIPLSCDSDDIEEMFKSSMVHHGYEGRHTFCNRCGQKLDWGATNGEEAKAHQNHKRDPMRGALGHALPQLAGGSCRPRRRFLAGGSRSRGGCRLSRSGGGARVWLG